MFAYGIVSQGGGMVGGAQRKMGRYRVGNPRPSTSGEEEEETDEPIVSEPEPVQTKTGRVGGEVEEELVRESVFLRMTKGKAAEEVVREPPLARTETRRARDEVKGKSMRGLAPVEREIGTDAKQPANSSHRMRTRKPVPRLYGLEKGKDRQAFPTSGIPQAYSENERSRGREAFWALGLG
jgi:hypothetical protein